MNVQEVDQISIYNGIHLYDLIYPGTHPHYNPG